MIRLVCLLFRLALLVGGCKKSTPVEPGTSLDLARERRGEISNLKYHLNFTIPADMKDPINADAEIRFDLASVPSLLQLDFKADSSNIRTVTVNGKNTDPKVMKEHVLIEGGMLQSKGNVVRIEFTAGEAALNRSAEYLYALFVPSRASTCFPVFDQPDLKAVYSLTLDLPGNWEAVTNGKELSNLAKGDRKTITFQDTKPISSYQFAFAAGMFRKATDAASGMTMYYRETDTAKVSRNLPKIFELHRQSIQWLEQYTGISYPFDKFDFALMPAFQFGGMEHPGAIFYRESSIILDPSASVNDELRRASLIAHETAHMWFGNLVTMEWFNDVWLKEVFANFMAAKIVNPGFPAINHELRFLMAHYPAALEIDRSAGKHPIQQPLDNLRNAGSIYGAIIYQKAPIMMRNLETLMGEENFRKGLQDYLHAYSYGNATWDDLVGALSKHTTLDLSAWNKAWIKTGGMPEVHYAYDPQGKKLTIENYRDSARTGWPQLVSYEVYTTNGNSTRELNIGNSGRAESNVDQAPLHILPNRGGRGYGFFSASPEDLSWMLEMVRTEEDALARAGIWINLWEHFLRKSIPIERMMNEVIASVTSESDPILMEYLTDKISKLYWQFMRPEDRGLISMHLEDAIFERMAIEKDPSLKRALYRAYVDVAISKQGDVNLIKFWNNQITLGIELSERDHIQLAYEIALRQAEGYEKILQQQLEQVKNPDRKAEISFILPALSADQKVRDQFFESLRKKENRTHEPWVLQAVRLLHHPLRGNLSEKYIPESLQMLEDLKRTQDIFFPKGWLDATLGEYQSATASKYVRDYLQQNKGLSVDLRNKLLQSSDMLFRASSVVSPE
ncbi:MAG: hypothetical protein JST14_04280 [Bacteroidetes bacterium]|nr:hypothetical protein [Bacteroidota bacterium]